MREAIGQGTAGIVSHVNLARGFRGGERQTELLIRELASSNVRQRLIARRGEPLIARLADLDGLEIRKVSGIRQAVAATKGSRLLHVHDGRSVQAGALASLLHRTPYIITRRVDNPIRANPVTRWMYARAAARVALSAAVAASMENLCPGLDVHTIPSAWNPQAADPEHVAALRSRFGDRFVAGCIGALDHSHKGQLTLIAAAAELPDTLFLIVGSGVDEQRLREAASGLENVCFEGQVDDVASYLAAMDLFVLPSLHEGLGSILLDAMHHGLPIVASAVGGIPEIVEDGVNGTLVPPGDAEALARAIRDLERDGERRQHYRTEALRKAPAFSPAAMAERYRELYDVVLGRAGA